MALIGFSKDLEDLDLRLEDLPPQLGEERIFKRSPTSSDSNVLCSIFTALRPEKRAVHLIRCIDNGNQSCSLIKSHLK